MVGSGLRRASVMFAALFIAVPALSFAQLPAKDMTPGKTSKASKEEICSGSYAASVKPVKPSDAQDAFDSYGIRSDSGRELYQLVPSSLGGTNDKQNLWPLPNSREFGPAQKKALDEKLHSMVCAGTIELKVAQDALKKNWMEAYKKYAQ